MKGFFPADGQAASGRETANLRVCSSLKKETLVHTLGGGAGAQGRAPKKVATGRTPGAVGSCGRSSPFAPRGRDGDLARGRITGVARGPG